MRVRTAMLIGLAVAAVALAGCSPAEPPPSADAVQVVGPQASATLAHVRAHHRLRCGVSDNVPGFAARNIAGQWRGFDVDFCRAVAAATLGDARAVSITALSSKTRLAALQSGAVDLVSGGAAWTFIHDAALGLSFDGVTFYDGQGFLARRSSGLKTIADIVDKKVCVLGGSTQQQALADAFKARGQAYQPVAKDKPSDVIDAFERRQCDVLTDDLSQLAAARTRLHAGEVVVLPGAIADEPLGLVTVEADPRWADIVRWTLNALVQAEWLQVTSQNAEDLRRDSANPAIRRLLGAEGELGRRLGLNDDWSYRAIRQVGTYGEIYARNLGPGGLNLDRGRNALWDADPPGQIYAPPLR